MRKPIDSVGRVLELHQARARAFAAPEGPARDDILRRAGIIERALSPKAPMLAGYEGRPPIHVLTEGTTDKEAKDRAVVMRNANHCTCCRLRNLQRGIERRALKAGQLPTQIVGITAMQHVAAEKLQDRFSISNLGDIRAVDWCSPPGGGFGSGSVPDLKMIAAEDCRVALLSVGEDGAHWLRLIVIQDRNLREAADFLRVHEKAALHSLRVSLGALAQHYGLPQKMFHVKQRAAISVPEAATG